MAKKSQFNVETLKSEAVRPLYAAAGVTDLAVEKARGYVSTAQTRVQSVDLEPKALQNKALELVNAGVDEFTKEAKARQSQLEKSVADLSDTYGELAARGEKLVARIRKQQATKDAKAAGKSTVARSKATKTTATSGAKKTASAAKATKTSASKTAKKSATATKAGAEKVGA